MHCPRCGAEALAAQQFCRSCGLNLERVAELLEEQPPTALDINLAKAQLRQYRLEHWASVAGLAMMSLVMLTLFYLVVSQVMIKGGNILAGLLLLTLFIGAAVVVGLQGYSKAMKQRLKNQHSALIADALHTVGATRQLDPHREPLTSVTEHTTELLSVPLPRKADSRKATTKEI